MAVDLFPVDVTIVSGQSLSPAVVANNMHLVGIVMPAGWDAAAITLQASFDGGTFNNAFDNNGAEITIQAAASRAIILPPGLLPGVQQLKVRSGTNAVAVNQTADRAIKLLFRRYW